MIIRTRLGTVIVAVAATSLLVLGLAGCSTKSSADANGRLAVVASFYPLAEAAQAHRDLESRQTIGPIVLLP